MTAHSTKTSRNIFLFNKGLPRLVTIISLVLLYSCKYHNLNQKIKSNYTRNSIRIC